MRQISQWKIKSNKFVKVFSGGRKITFQKTTNEDKNHRSRGVTINENAFHHIEDVSINPTTSIDLDKNIVLKNCDGKIYLVKYCFSRDEKCCNGGLFIFTMEEWFYFWNVIRVKIFEKIKE